jgi:outer membrane protein assembly factor BamB
MARTRAFAFSLSAKTVSAWAPTFSGTTPFLPNVRLVRATPTAIFVGGYFTSAGGAARTNVAALDPTTGTATAWAPPALGTQAAQDITVRALAVAADRVFVGGGSGIDSVYALDVSGDRVVVGRPQSGDLTAPALFAADTRTGEVCWKTALGNAQGFYRTGVARGVVFGGGLTGTLFTASSSYKAFALGSGSPLTWGGDLFATDGSAGTVEDIAVAPNGAVAMTGNRVAKGALTTGAPKLMVHKP